jgi:hypothetical protein
VAGQQSFSFDHSSDRSLPAAEPYGRRVDAAVVLATGAAGLGNEAAERLLERALVDSGLAAHAPIWCRGGDGVWPAYWRRPRRPPRIVVAFGAEAAAQLLHRPVSLGLERGKVRRLPEGGIILVTEHPRAILRLSDPLARGREYRRLVNDLLLAVPHSRLAA